MQAIITRLISIQHDLHTHPELSFQEYQTTNYIERILNSWNIPFTRFENLKSGGYCDIGNGPLIAFRSDIDALPILENDLHPIKSQINGAMHACGHDFHTVIGLGMAKYFYDHPDKLNHKKLRVFFQPGEEAAPGGAEQVLAETSWKNIHLILAVHVAPNLPPGIFNLFDGAVQASSTSLKIEITGPGGHTSKPEETLDLIRLSALFIDGLQHYLEHSLSKNEKLVFAFGSVHGGETHNIIPQSVHLRGSFRTLNNRVLNQTMQRIESFSKSFDSKYSTKTVVSFPTNCPATINNTSLVQAFARYMQKSGKGDNVVWPKKPSMGADDFAFYAQQVPGLYLIVGGGGNGTLHSGDLELSEDLIEPTLSAITDFIGELDLSAIV